MTPRAAVLSTATAFAFVLVACGGGEPDAAETETTEALPAPAGPAVLITQPQEGAVIQGTSVTVVLEVTDLLIAPAGTMDAGTGHHHLVVDAELPGAGAPIPTTPGVHIHMGQAQTEMALTGLTPGEHRVIAVVGDGAHVPLSPWVVDTVRFVVR